MTVQCPNCGKQHEPRAGNNYCAVCVAFFRRVGGHDFINDRGELGYLSERPAEIKAPE